MSSYAKKRGKRGAGRFVQLSEHIQSSEAWATLKPGPRALYIELKRRYNGSNNGQLVLSHRDAAAALNVNRNTVGPWFNELEVRGFITMRQAAYLGPSGVGQAPWWSLQELPTVDGKPPERGFAQWQTKKSLSQKTGRGVPNSRTPGTR